jgi:hypothetical protein
MNRRRFLQTAGVGAGLGMTGAGWAFHDRLSRGYASLQPGPGETKGLRILGYCDMGIPSAPDGSAIDPRTNLPWDRTAEFQVRDGYAYCGNYQGFSIVDVRDPRNMKVVFRYANDPGPDNTQYIDLKDNILVQKTSGLLKMWDVSHPAAPVFLSSFAPPGILVTRPNPAVQGSFGYHGIWVHKDHRTGGRFVLASVRLEGYTDQILMIVDITNPSAPHEISRWHYPGMWTAGGETPTWPTDQGSPGQTGTPVQAHDFTTYGDRAYAAWRDKGIIIFDISNMANPVRLGEISWGDVSRTNFAPIASQVHSVGIVVPKGRGRVETIVTGDEVGLCPGGYMHIVDVRNEAEPIEISNFMTPFSRGGNCPYDRPVSRIAIHDVERMIRGDIVWSAWEEGGFWGVDISDIHRPDAAAWFVPPVRSDSARGTSHGDDVYVTQDGIIFGSSSDAGAGGLWAMRYVPGLKGTVTWNTQENDVLFRRTD